MKLIDKIIGSEDKFPLEARCLNAVLFVAVFISLFSLIVDIIQNLGSETYLFALGMFICFTVMYYLGITKPRLKNLSIPFILINLLPTLYVWYIHDGLSGPALLYWLTIIVILPIITKGKLRKFVLSTFILLLTIAFIIELNNPEFVINYSEIQTEIIDLYISAVCIAIGLVSLIILVLYSYNRQRIIAENNSKVKDKLFSIIAHDLRGPLGSLNGFIHLLIENHDNLPQEKQKEFLEFLSETSRNTYNLLENLLDWSRLNGDELIPSPTQINLKEITDKTVQTIKSSSDKKNQKIISNLEPTDTAFADYNMIWTVIRNLISNAIKFTPKDGEIIISSEKNNGSIKISVNDTGIGIDEENLEKIKNEINIQSTKGTDNESGTGIGLKLCRDFININNGDFDVESQINVGSQFSFTLPKQKSIELINKNNG